MQGVKFRAMASPILLAQFKALGANAIPIPFPEVYNALQSGVAEGQENPYWAIHKMRFFEVQKYLSVSSHGVIVVYILASQQWWNRLPADLQKIVSDVFIEGEKVTWEVSQTIDREAVKAMQAAGLTFITIAPEERQRFRQATVAAIGGVMYPAMLEAGYQRRFTLGLIVNASDIALLIPPSISMIIFGVVTNSSVGALFIGG